MAYRETRNVYLLETARRVADYYINRLPNDCIPYWDFDDPAIPDAPRDSSAGGNRGIGDYWNSGTLIDSKEDRERYHAAAKTILTELASDRYLNTGNSGDGGYFCTGRGTVRQTPKSMFHSFMAITTSSRHCSAFWLSILTKTEIY